jgi:two-component system, LytTR family, sensor histidine kinase AlgZ
MSPYWICQLVGWSLFGLITAAIPTLYGGMRPAVVGRAVVGAVLGVLLTDALRRHMRRHGWLRLPTGRLFLRITAASLAIAGLMVLGVLPFLLAIIPVKRAGALAAISAGHAMTILLWCGIYLAVHHIRVVREAERERWRLQVAMQATELRALRAQLNPHFLFNNLNSLRALVGEDPARAQEAVTGLAGLLRYALQSSRVQTVALERELEATRHYLELEALRFEARLHYRIDVDPDAMEHQVPPMLLQTLVENAIKHGIARLPEGGSVLIEARRQTTDLLIRVTNTGRLDGADPEGTGLANSQERLRLLFGDRATLSLAPTGAGEVTCTVVVPGRAP